jgi:hypothetical protein
VFLWKIPFVTPRIISGCATFKAAEAASLSPDSMASSTFLKNDLILDLRFLLTTVRRSI